MSNLKLRFSPSKATPASPPPPSPDAPDRVLNSKFSTETLNIKTPRLPSISHVRWFSSSNSTPATPPSRPAKPYHHPSASESRLNISTPTMPTRGGEADEEDEEEEVLNSIEVERRAKVMLVANVDEAFEFEVTHSVSRAHLAIVLEPVWATTSAALAPSPILAVDVGGRKFCTSARTLVREDGKGGKLGEFVESAVQEVVRRIKRVEKSPCSAESLSLYPSSEVGGDEDSFLSLGHFDVSPCPSPFPYSSYAADDDLAAAALVLDRDSTLIVPSTPGSPIDPYNRKIRRLGPTARTSCSSTSSNPFSSVLGPFFQALSSSDSLPTFEHSLLPVDSETYTAEEDQSRSTLLGIPRGSGWVRGPRAMRAVAVPRLGIITSETGSRLPSLSMSLSSEEAANEPAEQDEDEQDDRPIMEVFLDRSGEVFGAVIAFLRDGALPPHLCLPTLHDSATPASVDPTTLSLFAMHPPAPLALLAALRDLRTEATWLGLQDLEDRCFFTRSANRF
ncbi:hypothetical protein RQP46_004525 [Phenoliferia psychrophenolica]